MNQNHGNTRTGKGWTLAFLLVLLLASTTRAEAPHEEVLRYVPPDVGFCLVLEDLRGHHDDLLASPFVEQIKQIPVIQKLLASKDLAQLRKVEQQLVNLLGVSWKDFREDIVGDAVVLAYRPGPPETPEREEGLVLIRARKARTLHRFVDALNNVQKLSGELLELQPHQHKGIRYFERLEQKRGQKKRTYYCLRGPVFLYSGQKEMLLRALEQEGNESDKGVPGKGEARKLSFVAQRFRELGVGRSLVRIWVNPRAFDAPLARKLTELTRGSAEERAQAVGLKTFSDYWKGLSSVGLFLRLNRELSFTLVVRGRAGALSPALQKLRASASKPSALWRVFPEDPLFAFAGRTDFLALYEALVEFLPKKQKHVVQTQLNNSVGAALGRDFVKGVLPAMGPDWGFCVLAPDSNNRKAWFPRTLLALRVSSEDSPSRTGELVPFQRSLYTALHGVGLLAVIDHNRKNSTRALMLQSVWQGKGEVTYLTHSPHASKEVLPRGANPTFAVKGGYLLLASSPQVVQSFSPPPVSSPRNGKPDKDKASQPVPILRISFRQWVKYLSTRMAPLSEVLAKKNRITPAKARAHLFGMILTFQLLDRLEISQHTSPEQVSVTLSLSTRKPLKKVEDQE